MFCTSPEMQAGILQVKSYRVADQMCARKQKQTATTATATRATKLRMFLINLYSFEIYFVNC